MRTIKTEIAVIGGGPAGLSSAIAAKENGADVLLIEREEQLGGILKQCIHDGFGLTRYGEKLTGPEYAWRDINRFNELAIPCCLNSFVTAIDCNREGYQLHLSSHEGITLIQAKSLILACGCRERTAKQVFIHGTRPAGVFTAGTAQNFVNRYGQMPVKRCVILGSGDIGLIMARRLTLEGAEVLGVYEVKSTPSGLKRNIAQCLDDFNIPLHLSMTVTRVFGNDRLSAVEVAKVDEHFNPIEGTQQIIECDGLIVSVGLIPENEIAEKLQIAIDPRTKGAVVDQQLQTSKAGVFMAGNCLSVNDLVDYVSENGAIAGKAAAEYVKKSNPTKDIMVLPNENVLYCVPQKINLAEPLNTIVYCRSRKDFKKAKLTVSVDGTELLSKEIDHVYGAQAIRVSVDFSKCNINENSQIEVGLKEVL